MRTVCWLFPIVLTCGIAAGGPGELPPLPLEDFSSTADESLLPEVPLEESLPSPGAVAGRAAPASRGETVDLRPPDLADLERALTEVEPSWLNDVIDDHLLLWRNVDDALQVVGKDGESGFGWTRIGFKWDIKRDTGPLWVSGYFGWNFLSGPLTPDVPAQTYDLGIEFNFAQQINELWGLHLQVSPLFATDFDNKSGDAFRLTAGGMVTYQADPVTKIVAGLVYLDRPDLNFLPIAGLKWMVTDNLEFDMLVPRPRIAWRFKEGSAGDDWLYLSGEVGGGSWAIEREGNLKDRMGYRDLRLLLGVESQQIDGDRRVLEAGYVFDRRLDFMRYGGDQNLGGTFVIRWGRIY